jgi:IMP cyclohydrolase
MVSKEAMKNLTLMAYPGRFIILGRDVAGAHDIVLYGITGRSASSRARRLERRGDIVFIRPTDPDVLKTGNADLLVYPALVLGKGIAVSNGKQTEDIDPLADGSPVRVLEKGLEGWTYEPDAPIFTPRISGCLLPDRRAALSLIKRGGDGRPERSFFEFPLIPGRGKLVATYAGENTHPLPVFQGEPLEIGIETKTAAETAQRVYAALRPEGRPEDFRVAVACVFAPLAPGEEREIAIVNRLERTAA